MAIFKNNPPIVTDGLMLYLDAANRQSYVSGSTTWRDLSGNKNNGTLVNGVGFSGDTLIFNGTTQNITTGNEVALDQSWTINYWQNVNITEDMFYIPPLLQIYASSGALSPGSMNVVFTNFTNPSSITTDSSNNIYVGGQYGGYDGIVRDTLVKINEDGSPNTLFNSRIGITNSGVYDVTMVHLS